MKSKSEFISDLLSNKRLSLHDRERILKLTVNTLNLESTEITEIWKEILNLKNSIAHPTKNSKILQNPLSPEEKELFENTGLTFEDLDGLLPTGLENETFENLKLDKDITNNQINVNEINSNKEFEEVPEDNKTYKLFPHNPIYTISFLKKFKIGDGSGFKELVHDVILSDEIMQEILNKAKSHPNFIYHYKNEWISKVSYLNEGILFEVRKLIDLFEKEGLPYFFLTGKHPFNNDQKYTDFALKFKKSYRYGSGKEYSKLHMDIADVFTEMNLIKCNLQFVPSERIFNIRSNFFTWEPSILKGLRFIFQGIRDHLNINGLALNEEKIIQIEAEDINLQGLRYLELRIIDFKSQANLNSEKLLHFLKESNPYKKDFRNLCDWIIECDFLEESSKRLNLLLAPEYSQSFEEIEELPNPINGFKHILRFYDVR